MTEQEAYCARCFVVRPKSEMVRRATGEEMEPGTRYWWRCNCPCDAFKEKQREKAHGRRAI